jgi:drug/metabolite transporter (DMT)-like permease
VKQRKSISVWNSAAILLVIATLCWSGNFIVGRAVAGQVPPIALAFWRWTLGFVLVIGPAWKHLRRDTPALRARFGTLLILSFLGIALFNSLVYVGLQTTTATNGVLMQSVMPLLILLFSYLLFKERVTRGQLAAVAISLVGVMVIVSRGTLQTLLDLAFAVGDAWIFLAVLGYGLYSVLLRQRPAVHPLTMLAATFVLGALMLLPFYLWESLAGNEISPTPTAIAAIVYVAVFPSLVAYLCFNRAIELIGANRVGQYLHLMPVFGSILAAIFLRERLQGFHLAGGLLIAAGIVLATYAGRRSRALVAPGTPLDA